jgi:hypothetical protein
VLRPRTVSSQTTLMRATAVTCVPVSAIILIANRPRAGRWGRVSDMRGPVESRAGDDARSEGSGVAGVRTRRAFGRVALTRTQICVTSLARRP